MHLSRLASVATGPAIAEILASIATTYRTGSVRSEPLVDALGVELVRAGQNAKGLRSLEVAHADHAVGLITLVRFSVELVGGQLLDFGHSHAPRFRLA